jgi:hypothetical protein
MRGRFFLSTLLFAGFLLPLVSCNSSDPSLTSIVISPTTVTVTLAPNGIAQGYSQFTAIGYYTHPNHGAETKDITSEVTWASSGTQVATIVTGGTNAGLATATGWVNGVAWTGVTNITASMPGYNGDIVSNAATFTVTDSSTTDDVISIVVTPNPYTFTALNASYSFTATGTTQSGVQKPLTTSSVWTSGNTGYVTVGANTGVATAVAAGTTTITAKYTNSDGTSYQGSATVTAP